MSRLWSWLQRPRGRAGVRPGFAALYLAAGLWLLSALASYYSPTYGFTYLLGVGDRSTAHYDWVAERGITVYELDRSSGYDAQYYAQLAIDPTLQDPTLAKSIDNLPYRARRILTAWTAYLIGLGQPDWALNVYALQNVVCWFLLGWLLLRWFPPVDLDRTFRWLGIMLSIGALFSVFSALVDVPSLLILAAGLWMIESGHRWRATALLALGGLTKETNLLGAAALAPTDWRKPRDWAMSILRGALVAAPLVLWFLVLQWRFSDTTSLAGVRNFNLPLTDFLHRWQNLLQLLLAGETPWRYLGPSLANQLSITTQVLFLLTCWRWSNPAWRLTVPFAALALTLGSAVWEGHPGASSRVLLPLLLGFNLLVPRGRRWWPLLLLGNLTLFFGAPALEPMPRPMHTISIHVPADLAATAPEQNLTIAFPAPWYGPESDDKRAWRWSAGDAAIHFHNPYPVPLEIELRGAWSSEDERLATLSQGEHILWRDHLSQQISDWRIANVILPPGRSELTLTSDRPPTAPTAADSRRFAVRLLHLQIRGHPVQVNQ